jgi:hypothetical protein
VLVEAAGAIRTIFTYGILDKATANETNLLQSTII